MTHFHALFGETRTPTQLCLPAWGLGCSRDGRSSSVQSVAPFLSTFYFSAT